MPSSKASTSATGGHGLLWLWHVVGPGFLVAATGVGAGDLATGALAGSKLGITVLWAVAAGAAMKFLVNEGLARWQLATGTTLLEGVARHFGLVALWMFLAYLVLWSYHVGAALITACGVALHGLAAPLGSQPAWVPALGIAHSALAVAIVWWGGFPLFERLMRTLVAIMFAAVITTAVMLVPSWPLVARALVLPVIPHEPPDAVQWTVALMGGVGGTVTILCYGYWIREVGRTATSSLRDCRLDLAVCYAVTALFGMSMVVIGQTIQVEGKGVHLVVRLGERLGQTMGWPAQWAFLAGAWCAVFSSLLGVWQSVPYLFADCWYLATRRPAPDNLARSHPYRLYLAALALIPCAGTLGSFVHVQKLYALVGALFLPVLALALLLLNGPMGVLDSAWRNRWWTNLALVAVLAFFLWVGWLEWSSQP